MLDNATACHELANRKHITVVAKGDSYADADFAMENGAVERSLQLQEGLLDQIRQATRSAVEYREVADQLDGLYGREKSLCDAVLQRAAERGFISQEEQLLDGFLGRKQSVMSYLGSEPFDAPVESSYLIQIGR